MIIQFNFLFINESMESFVKTAVEIILKINGAFHALKA